MNPTQLIGVHHPRCNKYCGDGEHYIEPTIRAGQVWWDRDHRVISQYVRVVEVLDDGRVVVHRGRTEQYGRRSIIRADRLRRRFTLLEGAS